MQTRRLVQLAGALVLLIACLPELTGFALFGSSALGLPGGHDLFDNLIYVELVQQAVAGKFPVPNLHTAERAAVHPQVATLPYAVAPLFRLFAIPPRYYPILSKVGFGALLLWVLALLAAREFEPEDRAVGLAHLWMAAGFFWVIDVGAVLRGHSDASYFDRIGTLAPEYSGFLSFYIAGHMALAVALLVGAIWAVFLRSPPSAARAALLGALIGLFHPYDLVTLACVSAVSCGYLAVVRDAKVLPRLRAAVAAGCGALPAALFHLAVSYMPVRSHSMDAGTLGTLDYVWGFGQPLFFAAYWLASSAALPREHGPEDRRDFVWVSWLAVTPLLVWNPFLFFRRKLALGLSVPVAILGARGVLRFCRTLFSERLRAGALAFFTALACVTPLDVALHDAWMISKNTTPAVLSKDTQELVEYLSHHGDPEQPVFTDDELLSHLLPSLASRRVYAGWRIFVIDPERKARDRDAFLSPGTPQRERAAFLRRYGIGQVVLSTSACRRIRAGELTFLRPEAAFGTFHVFAVAPAGR